MSRSDTKLLYMGVSLRHSFARSRVAGRDLA